MTILWAGDGLVSKKERKHRLTTWFHEALQNPEKILVDPTLPAIEKAINNSWKNRVSLGILGLLNPKKSLFSIL
jgi:hypothetical protein